MQLFDNTPFQIHMYDHQVYDYPVSAVMIGWLLAFSSVSMIPILAIKTIWSKPGTLSQVIRKSKYDDSIVP